MSEKQRKIAFMLALIIFILFSIAVTCFVGIPMVRMAEDPEVFRDWVDDFGIWSRLLFVGMVVLQVVVALIPGEPLELAGGYAFGTIEGTIWSMVGIVIGSALIFLLVRKLGVRMVEVFFSRKQIREFAFLKNPKKTKIIAFILMLIPGTPKDFFSYFAGLTKLTLKEWLTIVTVARIPSLVTSTISGGAAGSENYVLAVAMFIFSAILSGIGVVYYRRICKQQQKEEQEQDTMIAG